MSDLYESVATIAADTIENLGKPITLIKKYLDKAWVKRKQPVPGGVQTTWTNSTTGEVVTVDPTRDIRYAGFAVEGSYKGTFYPGLTIASGDIRLYIVNTPKPREGDGILVGGVLRTVISCAPVEPGTVTILHDVQVR